MTGRYLLILGMLLITATCTQGCVPVYCAISNSHAPKSEPLEMFLCETGLISTHQPPLDNVAIMPSEQGSNIWTVFNSNYYDNLRTIQIVVDQHGNYIETLPYRNMRGVKGHLRFTDEPKVYENANISVVIEEDTYPQILEVEAWLRQTFGRLVAPAMGKSSRAFIYDSSSRFACCPPRVAITTTLPDGTSTTRRFTLPDSEYDWSWSYGTLISEDGQFLYIYYRDMEQFFV